MAQAGSIRIDRGVAAGIVLVVHVLVVWIVVQARIRAPEQDPVIEPVIATLLDQPRRIPFGAVPIEVHPEKVQHLQSLAPKLPDIAEDIPQPVPDAEPVPASPPAAAVGPQENSITPGNDDATTGPRGGGRLLVLVQRVVPRYPRISVRRGEQGSSGVQLRVDERGRVVEARISRTSGSSELDDAAIAAVKKWRFARAPGGSAPRGTWGQTEIHFVLYRYTYSRIAGRAVDSVFGEQVKSGATDEPAPGSEAALKRFIAAVMAGEVTGAADPELQKDLAKMRKALREWGNVTSLQFTGNAGERAWVRYDIKPEPGTEPPTATVDVKWDMYEVRHEHATSEWLIAVDRQGTIWSAQTGPAPR